MTPLLFIYLLAYVAWLAFAQTAIHQRFSFRIALILFPIPMGALIGLLGLLIQITTQPR
jgi:hypothetical protein